MKLVAQKSAHDCTNNSRIKVKLTFVNWKLSDKQEKHQADNSTEIWNSDRQQQ